MTTEEERRTILIEKAISEKHNRALSIIVHDLKSPMTAIIGFSNLLLREMEEKGVADRWLEILKRVVGAGKNMDVLIQDISTMAKMEAGKEKIEPEWADIPRMLYETRKTFEYQAKTREISIDIVAEDSLPPVRWDMTRLRNHVLNNLISNSLKFTPLGGKVTLSAQADSSHVLLNVKDTGPGIPPGEHEKIFHRFEQLDIDSQRIFSGFGLGLYNARLFVERHGGQISLDPSVDTGASFLIRLPLDASPAICS